MKSFLQLVLRETRNYLKKTDLYLVVLALMSSAFGLVLIYSATRSYGSNKFLIVQLAAVFLGLVCYVIASLVDIDTVSELWFWLFLFNLVLLFTVVPFGVSGDTGNRSWIRFGPIGVQPAEIGKIIFIVTFAKHLSLLKDRLNHVLSILQLGLHALITFAFVYLFSKDLGMAMMYLLIFVIMMFASGVYYRYFAIGGALCAAALPFVWKNVFGQYQKDRILVVFDPSVNADIAYHAEQSQIAIGAGQVTGRGFLEGTQTQYSILPTKHTDFIFSVSAEEFGFFGAMLIIGLLTLLILRCFYVAFRSTSDVGRLVCVGIGGMLLFQTFLNIGMCLGIMPVIGLTLPLYSYGGTSVVTMYTALGIVAGVRMRGKPSWLR